MSPSAENLELSQVTGFKTGADQNTTTSVENPKYEEEELQRAGLA